MFLGLGFVFSSAGIFSGLPYIPVELMCMKSFTFPKLALQILSTASTFTLFRIYGGADRSNTPAV